MFHDNLLVPSSIDKKSKTDQSNTKVTWHNILFSNFIHHLVLLHKHNVS